ncbi:MAG: hypothetical protein E7316_03135 [Clostridiales bacterium]|nr:hypothetical protein [Clostridiales bacterium]
MKYENARDLLPEPLLRQVQKYISGKLVYVPARERKRAWGAASGYREYLRERNREIRARFAVGDPIEQLADKYHLSCESIKRIVYCRKETMKMEYQGTLSSAQEWARQGGLEDWVHAYLLSDGHNKPFSDGLKIVDRIFLGPIAMPLDLFHRCTGPVEEGLKYQIHPEVWERGVRQMMEAIPQQPDLPPLIAHYLIPEGKTLGEFELNDGNHRWEAYKRLGIREAHVIVWITDREEYEQFMQRYGEYVK